MIYKSVRNPRTWRITIKSSSTHDNFHDQVHQKPIEEMKKEKQEVTIYHYIKNKHEEREGCEKQYGNFDVAILS
jgi:ABC-type nickel/cobalt efflux system permease component RcnA